MLILELLTWFTAGILLAAVKLRLRAYEPLSERAEMELIGSALGGVAGGVIGRVITGPGTFFGGYSTFALLCACAGAMVVIWFDNGIGHESRR